MDEEAQRRLLQFSDLLRRWNRAFNLVSRKDVHRLESRHLDDSLRLLVEMDEPGALLDIGSGGGLPGLVLAIAEPQRPVVLLDRSERKCRFLAQAAAELQLANAQVLCADIDSYEAPHAFTYVASRAVAPADVVWRWAEPRLAKGGKMLHMTGGETVTVRIKV